MLRIFQQAKWFLLPVPKKPDKHFEGINDINVDISVFWDFQWDF